MTQSNGMKFDQDKLRWDLMPFDVLDVLTEVITYGAVKYAPNNWQQVERDRYEAALMRHISKDLQGEVYDPESGLRHKAHAMCNLMFLIWKDLNDNA